MPDLVGHGDVRHGGGNVFAVVQYCYNPRVKAFKAAAELLKNEATKMSEINMISGTLSSSCLNVKNIYAKKQQLNYTMDVFLNKNSYVT